MTVQAKIKHQSTHSKTRVQNNTQASELMKLFNIAIKMKKAGLSDNFIVSAVRAALEYEGVSDLMNLWINEDEKSEKDEIVADIQEMVDVTSKDNQSREMYVKFNDLEMIAKDIRGFKDSLLQVVIERGGISRLAELTGMPQPSLSRFFNSNAMPRRSTVLEIANALNLDKLPIDLKWSK